MLTYLLELYPLFSNVRGFVKGMMLSKFNQHCMIQPWVQFCNCWKPIILRCLDLHNIFLLSKNVDNMQINIMKKFLFHI